MHCLQCGFENPGGFRFCGGCGARLEEEAAPPAREPDGEATAERRQLTVLFCDLVGSTGLSERLDPEELREVVQAYQQVCADVVGRFEGYIAQYLGDGILIYFGFPRAHEDDALRGIHAGLGILAAIAELSRRVEAERGLSLAVRLGLHTGQVVAGEVGAGSKREQLALGKTPNLAARLQAVAEPGTLVVSQEARRLTAGQFTFTSLGEQTLKGISQPVLAFRVDGESGEGRFAGASARGLAPLVGRARPLALLQERFAAARAGGLEAVLLVGEAGLGKSRLLHDLGRSLAGEPHTWGTWHSSPFYQNSALHPFMSHLQKALRFTAGEAPPSRLRKLRRAVRQAGMSAAEAAETVPLLAALLSIPPDLGGYTPLDLSPQRQKERTLEAIVALLVRQAAARPVVFAVEDLHWVDPTTLEFLALLLQRARDARLLLLLTCRPSFEIPWPASRVRRLVLDRLSDGEVEALVAELTGGMELPPPVLAEIVRKTDGVPLFVEELTRMVLESGLLHRSGGLYQLTSPLPALAIPATLQDSLMARLDRLNTVKEIAQLGAVLGREFDFGLLSAVSTSPEEDLASGLARMVESELLLARGQPPHVTYVFRHALLQDAAYGSLLKSTRQRLHRRIAGELERRFQARDEIAPELLAHHCTEAGLTEPALGYWLLSGQQAIARSANREAVAHLRRALELLSTLPPGPERDGRELALQVTLASPLCSTLGYGATEMERVLTRAHELCRNVGQAPEIPSILFGLGTFYATRGDLHRALELALELLEKAETSGDVKDQGMAHHEVGVFQLYRAELVESRKHLERAVVLSSAEPGSVLPTGEELHVTRAWLATALWYMGYPDQALTLGEESLRTARESRNSSSLLVSLGVNSFLRHLRREPAAVRALAEEVVEVARDQGPFWEVVGRFFVGWAAAHLGDEAGIERLRQALRTYQSLGTRLCAACYTAIVAALDTQAGKAERLRLLKEALASSLATGDCFWDSEIHRYQGEIALEGDGSAACAQAAAERCFLRALEISQATQAKSLELRAATSLARLRLRQERFAEGRELLAGVYGWFTEGFATDDLREARELLARLS